MAKVALEAQPLSVGSIDHRASGWWGMLGVIATEGALFAYLLFSYYYVALQPHTEPWLPEVPPSLRLALPNTIILILSSVAVWWGERGARKHARWRALLGLAIGFVLGAIFIGIQLMEWHNKSFSVTSHPYGSLYFTITGFHLAHVLMGLFVLLSLIVWIALGYFSAPRDAPISIGSIYWHFVDVVWLTVFFTFYITPHFG